MEIEKLLSDETFENLFKIENEIERIKETNALRAIAKENQMLTNFNDVLKLKLKKQKAIRRELKFPITDEEGNPKNLQVNVLKLLQFYDIQVQYNELKKEIDVIMEGSSEVAQDNKNEILEELIYDKCIQHDFSRLSKDRLSSMLLTFADINKTNPVKEYLDTLYPLASTYYIDKLCATITTTDDMSREFKKLLIKTWLISCVRAAYSKTGFSAHGVLVLQGEQGLGKTSWFRKLVPNEEWFKDGLSIDTKNKDTIIRAVKYWIAELGEIGSTVKKDFDSFKAFITQDRDELRRAFARKESFYPRRTIFCGSVNQDEYLVDDSGNRRFWTIPVVELDYQHNIDINMLWSEILYWSNRGERHYLTKEEQQQLAQFNTQHEIKDYVDTLIEEAFDWDSMPRYKLTSSDIFRELGRPVNVTLTKISRALTKKGLKMSKSNGNRYYNIPISKTNKDCWHYKDY